MNTSPNKITVASCANEKFATGLTMSLASCLAQSSGQYFYEIVVLDGGLSESSKTNLRACLNKISLKVGTQFSIDYIMPSESLTRRLPNRAGTWMTYARFLLPELLTQDSVVYLDSDILCFRGIEEYYENWDGQAAVVAARDPKQTIDKDWPNKRVTAPKNALYFNAGLILMNLNWMREHLSLDKVFKLIAELGQENLKFHDQTILNYACRGQVIEVPRENNWVLATEYAIEVPNKWQELNIHYVGRVKPWLRDNTEARRHIAEVLYREASIEYGVGDVSKRTVDTRDLKKVQRKALLYRFIKPRRAQIYQSVLRSLKSERALQQGISSKDFYRVTT